jgi:hypothetical protein
MNSFTSGLMLDEPRGMPRMVIVGPRAGEVYSSPHYEIRFVVGPRASEVYSSPHYEIRPAASDVVLLPGVVFLGLTKRSYRVWTNSRSPERNAESLTLALIRSDPETHSSVELPID